MVLAIVALLLGSVPEEETIAVLIISTAMVSNRSPPFYEVSEISREKVLSVDMGIEVVN